MYVGKGNIQSRIESAHTSKRRKNLRDHFSWYAIKNPAMMHDIEVLMLRLEDPKSEGSLREAFLVRKQAVFLAAKTCRGYAFLDLSF
jgi:hypothetical protein